LVKKNYILVLFLIIILFSVGCSTKKYNKFQYLLANGIESNNLEFVKCAIDKKVDLNSLGANTIDSEKNPLFTSLCNSDKRIVLLLLENGVDVNYKAGKLYDGANCLMIAASNRYEDVCQLLIKKGIDINEKDNQGQNAIDYAIQAGSNSYLEEKEILKLVKMLYKEGVEISNKTKENILNEDESPHEMGQTNIKYEIIKWLIDIGEINELDLNKNQKIFYEIYLDNLKEIKKLSESQLNIKNSQYQDLLVVASKYGRTDIVKYLLEKGFNPKEKIKDTFYWNAIVYAATSGNLETLKTITKSCKLSDKELYRIICSSIDMLKIDDEYVDGISYLADLMENINEADGEEDNNILSKACSKGLYKTSEILMNKKNIDLNGNVLYEAVMSKNISIIKLLIKNNIDVNQKPNYHENEETKFVLYDAIMNGDYDIAKLLIENGATIDKEMLEYIDGHVSKRMRLLIESNL